MRFKIHRLLFVLTVLMTGFSGCHTARVVRSAKESVKKNPDPRAVAHFVDGVIQDLNQNPAAALLAYQEALLYDSTSAPIYQAIGRNYLLLGRHQSGMISLRRALEIDSDDIETRELLAKVYASQGKWEMAERTFHEIIAQDSLYIEPYYTLALIALQKGDVEKSIQMYRRILDILPAPNPQVLLSLGELYVDIGRYEEAEAVYYQLIELNPQDGFGYFGIGLAREALEDTTGAVEKYLRAIQFDPGLTPAIERLSLIYKAKKEWDKAIALNRTAIDRDSTEISRWLEIGDILRFKEDTAAAVEIFHEVARRFPEDWRPVFEIGRIYLNREEFQTALEHFRQVTELDGKTFWGWLFSGITLVSMDSLNDSKPYLRRCLDIAPRHPLGNYFLGTVLAQENKPGEAIPYLETALEIRPDWVAALIPIAGAYESMRDYIIADSLFEKAIRLDPDNALLLNNYGYSLSQRGERLEEAIEMARKALMLSPDNGAYLDTVGWIYFKMGDYDKALEFVEKAYDIRNDSADVVDHLGDIYSKLGMIEKAREFWEKALELDRGNRTVQMKLNRLIGE